MFVVPVSFITIVCKNTYIRDMKFNPLPTEFYRHHCLYPKILLVILPQSANVPFASHHEKSKEGNDQFLQYISIQQ